MLRTLSLGKGLGILIALLASHIAAAQGLQISNAWVRLPPPGAEVAAAYLTLVAQRNTSLVKVETPAAGSVQLHSMKMKNGVMEMRELPKIDLPAGKPISLKPGDVHLMLFEIKPPLKEGDALAFAFFLKDASGKTEKAQAMIPVRKTP